MGAIDEQIAVAATSRRVVSLKKSGAVGQLGAQRSDAASVARRLEQYDVGRVSGDRNAILAFLEEILSQQEYGDVAMMRRARKILKKMF